MPTVFSFPAGFYSDNVTSIVLVNNTAKTQFLTVPTGKAWMILGGIVHNGDDVARNVSVVIRTSSDVWLQVLYDATSVAAGAEKQFPTSDMADGSVGPSAYPVMAFSGEKVKFTYAAGGASAGGTENSYLRTLEMIYQP